MEMDYISTGSPTLDCMISGATFPRDRSTDFSETGGIPKGTDVLIRGEPGSGKTTLAMQILSNYLAPKDAARHGEGGESPDGRRALFLSYEESAESLIGNEGRLRGYQFFRDYSFKEKSDQLFAKDTSGGSNGKEGTPDEKLKYSVLSRADTPSVLMCIDADTFLRSIPEWLFKMKRQEEPDEEQAGNEAKKLWGDIAAEAKDAVNNVLDGNWAKAAIRFGFGTLSHVLKHVGAAEPEQEGGKQKSDEPALPQGCDLIVVDSLNAFMSLMQDRFPDTSPRILLGNLCDIIRTSFGKGLDTTIILTSEYHYHPSELSQTVSESFFCDVEIMLRPEPVCVPESYEPTIQTPIGYNLNTLIGEESKSIESRSFCRVTKSRPSRNQSRRCVYDIVPGKGFEFYDTYPGDGKIVLFAENGKQQFAWRSFFEHDIPDSYPALRHEVFDRISMQTVYEGQRRLRNIPLKTDMCLSSFDSYWVSWYRDFKLKCDIDKNLQRFMVPQRDQKAYSILVNIVMRIIKEDQGMKDRNLCGLSPVALRYLGWLLGCDPRYMCMLCYQTCRAIYETLPESDRRTFWDDGRTFPEPEGLSAVERLFTTSESVAEEEIKRKKEACLKSFSMIDRESVFSKTFSSFLQPLPYAKLRLFGERRSRIIWELVKARAPLEECAWCEDIPEETRRLIAEEEKETKGSPGQIDKLEEALGRRWQDTSWLAIPYDANISFFVYRKDILSRIKGQLDLHVVKRELCGLLREEARLLLEHLDGAMEGAVPGTCVRVEDLRDILDKDFVDDPSCSIHSKKWNYLGCLRRMVDYVARRIVDGKVPETWEEMIVLARLLNKHICIETQSFNTYMCTFLEILWNCGAENLRLHPDYTFDDAGTEDEGGKKTLESSILRSFHILRALFRSSVVEPNSTLETKTPDGTAVVRDDITHPDGWIFARHWYSTLIENLTAKDQEGHYIWGTGQAMDLEIMPVPTSLFLWIADVWKALGEHKDEGEVEHFMYCQELHRCEEIRNCPRAGGCFFKSEHFRRRDHHSCWGEWSFGLLTGSENANLAIDLINNMMSSSKINERAFNSACIPTVEDFYAMYGQLRCVDLPERPDVTMPSLTYQKLREKFFQQAKSRLTIHDFRHFSKIVHSKLEIIRKSQASPHQQTSTKKEDLDYIKMVEHLIEDVESFRNLPILLDSTVK